jgi:mycothiol system anti-sigma-R factor
MKTRIGCEEVIEKLFEFIDRELDESARREVEQHLETCRGCFSRAEFERRLRARVAQAAQARAPDRLRQRIRMIVAHY